MIHTHIIPLNLVFSYPVKWSKYKVLRDFLQNFYDAIGHKNWADRFHWRWERNCLILEASEVAFSYEWLLHIGASTKRTSGDRFAGYFGEGFKIASLCALRDHGWQIQMASQNWILEVTTTKLMVDQTELESLAYRMHPRPTSHRGSKLQLSPLTEHHELLFQSVRLSFYYRENPLLGHCLWESDEAAIYLRSTIPKPADFPQTYDSPGPGIIFAGFQALGSIRYPWVICLHTFRFDDRERNSLYLWDILDLIGRVVQKLPPDVASVMLEGMSDIWYRYPKKRRDINSWHHVVEKLVLRIAKSEEVQTAWKTAHPNLVVARKVRATHVVASNRRRLALDWLRSRKRGFRLVQEGFLALGYPELETLCEAADGFIQNRPPNPSELACVAILETAAQSLFAQFIPEGAALPRVMIIQNNTASWQGMANCHRLKQPQKNAFGYLVRHRLSHIELKQVLFKTGLFSMALSTYLHELAHAFGGDRSRAFSAALTDMLEVALQYAVKLEEYSKRWDDMTRHHPDS
ncbi:MAG: hypothetical protein HQL75_18665 [Magnetococcales bacterium]|nr:hypothetical protein [Magnetococcales bacterium]